MHIIYHIPIYIYMYVAVPMYRLGGPVLYVFFNLNTCTCVYMIIYISGACACLQVVHADLLAVIRLLYMCI